MLVFQNIFLPPWYCFHFSNNAHEIVNDWRSGESNTVANESNNISTSNYLRLGNRLPQYTHIVLVNTSHFRFKEICMGAKGSTTVVNIFLNILLLFIFFTYSSDSRNSIAIASTRTWTRPIQRNFKPKCGALRAACCQTE